MSFHAPLDPEGSEMVARLDDIADPERLIVWSLRRWLEGPDAQAEVWNAFATRLGPGRGRRALKAFEGYLAAVAAATTRRLCRHAPSCPCLGRDEADLAAIVALAGQGATADAAERGARFITSEGMQAVIMAAVKLGGLVAGCDLPRAGLRRESSAPRNAGFRWQH